MRIGRVAVGVAIGACVLLTASVACGDDKWIEGKPDLETWGALSGKQLEMMQAFIKFADEFDGGLYWHNNQTREIDVRTRGDSSEMSPLVRQALPGVASVSVTLKISHRTGWLGELGRPLENEQTVHGRPTVQRPDRPYTVSWETEVWHYLDDIEITVH